MRITKFGHACVRIEHEGHVVVLDPGVFTDPEAVAGATAVLVTHLHPDHLHPENLRATDAPVFSVGQVAEQLATDAPDVAERTTTVPAGAAFDIGVPVRAVGELHNVIHPELPQPYNSGYLLTFGDQVVYHPGTRSRCPRCRSTYCSARRPRHGCAARWRSSSCGRRRARNLAIHDRVYSEAGHGLLAMQMETLVGPRGQEWLRIADGADL